MAKIRYIGLSHHRRISYGDFKSIGFPHQAELKLDRNEVADVSDEVATWLLQHEGPDWQLIGDDAETENPASPNIVAPINDAIPSSSEVPQEGVKRSGRS